MIAIVRWNFVPTSEGGREAVIRSGRRFGWWRKPARGFLGLLNQCVSLRGRDPTLSHGLCGNFPEGLHIILMVPPGTKAWQLSWVGIASTARLFGLFNQ